MKPRFFATRQGLRAWLERHHETATELWVGIYKKASGRPSVTWPEVVDEALCFGWIDGVRQGIDDVSYANRLTPRTPTSNWSAKNAKRFEELQRQERVRPAGIAAFEERSQARTGGYSYEQRHEVRLDASFERRFRANRKAWRWFRAQSDGYRATARYWVMSAKRQETRERRLATLIDDSANGRRIALLRR